MSKRLRKRFEFNYPVTESSVVNGRPTQTHLGDIRVEGVGYEDTSAQLYALHPDEGDRYDVDIDSVYWNGINIYSLLTNKCEELMDDIQEAALHHVTGLFSPEHINEQKTVEQIDAIMQARA